MTELNEAWNHYFEVFADHLQTKFDQAQEALHTLKVAREKLGLSFLREELPSGEIVNNSPGAWTSLLQQDVANLREMTTVAKNALKEAAQGKRKVHIDPDGNFHIESLPTDKLVINNDSDGAPYLSLPDGTPTPGTVGIPWVAVGVVGVVVTAAQAYVISKAIDSLETLAEQKTLQTVAAKQAEVVTSGKATPEQAQAMTSAIYQGATELQKEKTQTVAAGSKATDPSQWNSLLKTAAFVGVLGFGAYVALQFLPKPSRA